MEILENLLLETLDSLVYDLLQLAFPEVKHLGEDVVAGVAAIDAVIAVGVVVHVKLFVGLHQCFRVLHAVAYVYIVVCHAMHQEQATVEIFGAANS